MDDLNVTVQSHSVLARPLIAAVAEVLLFVSLEDSSPDAIQTRPALLEGAQKRWIALGSIGLSQLIARAWRMALAAIGIAADRKAQLWPVAAEEQVAPASIWKSLDAAYLNPFAEEYGIPASQRDYLLTTVLRTCGSLLAAEQLVSQTAAVDMTLQELDSAWSNLISSADWPGDFSSSEWTELLAAISSSAPASASTALGFLIYRDLLPSTWLYFAYYELSGRSVPSPLPDAPSTTPTQEVRQTIDRISAEIRLLKQDAQYALDEGDFAKVTELGQVLVERQALVEENREQLVRQSVCQLRGQCWRKLNWPSRTFSEAVDKLEAHSEEIVRQLQQIGSIGETQLPFPIEIWDSTSRQGGMKKIEIVDTTWHLATGLKDYQTVFINLPFVFRRVLEGTQTWHPLMWNFRHVTAEADFFFEPDISWAALRDLMGRSGIFLENFRADLSRLGRLTTDRLVECFSADRWPFERDLHELFDTVDITGDAPQQTLDALSDELLGSRGVMRSELLPRRMAHDAAFYRVGHRDQLEKFLVQLDGVVESAYGLIAELDVMDEDTWKRQTNDERRKKAFGCAYVVQGLRQTWENRAWLKDQLGGVAVVVLALLERHSEAIQLATAMMQADQQSEDDHLVLQHNLALLYLWQFDQLSRAS